MVSNALLPVDAAEFGREVFGVVRLDESGVFARKVALRARTCICSLLRAIVAVGRRRCDAAEAALRRPAAAGGLAGGRGFGEACFGCP